MNSAGKIVLKDWIEGYAKIVKEPLSNDKLLEQFQALATGKDGTMDVLTAKDMARIVTKSKTRDDEQQKKYSEMVQTMIDEYGYNEDSAEEILAYASNNLWRDS